MKKRSLSEKRKNFERRRKDKIIRVRLRLNLKNKSEIYEIMLN
jgi:hypothetical protein